MNKPLALRRDHALGLTPHTINIGGDILRKSLERGNTYAVLPVGEGEVFTADLTGWRHTDLVQTENNIILEFDNGRDLTSWQIHDMNAHFRDYPHSNDGNKERILQRLSRDRAHRGRRVNEATGEFVDAPYEVVSKAGSWMDHKAGCCDNCHTAFQYVNEGNPSSYTLIDQVAASEVQVHTICPSCHNAASLILFDAKRTQQGKIQDTINIANPWRIPLETGSLYCVSSGMGGRNTFAARIVNATQSYEGSPVVIEFDNGEKVCGGGAGMSLHEMHGPMPDDPELIERVLAGMHARHDDRLAARL